MHPKRLLRAGTSLEVSVLAVMTFLLGAGCLAFAARPMAPHAPRALMTLLGVVGISVAALLVVAGPRVTRVWLHVTTVFFVGLISVMVASAVTERGLMLSALGYMWAAVYIGFFYRPVAARRYSVVMIAAFGIGLLSAHAPADVSVWVVISAMVWVAVAVLSPVNERLRSEAHTDSLTGVLNRTGFAHAAARQRGMSERRGEPLALAVIDLDDFKEVNDRNGHAAGDRLLVELAEVWSTSLRPGDLLARFGGDEFVLLFPGAGADQVDHLLARLVRAHPASWTSGWVICSSDETLDESIGRADERLYDAKASRRPQAARPAPHASLVPSLDPSGA